MIFKKKNKTSITKLLFREKKPVFFMIKMAERQHN